MAALSTFRDTKSVTLGSTTLKLGTGVIAYAGGLVCTDTATGYGVAGQVKTGLVARGIARSTVDNSAGQAGDKSVAVEEGRFWLDIYGSDPVTQANVDQPVFIYDDHTIAATDGNAARSVAGVLRAVDAARGALVEVSCANQTAMAAEIAAREALEANLADQDTLAGVLTGKSVANTANAAVIGGLEVVHRIAIADAATADTDVVLTHKTMVTDVLVIKTAGNGGSGDTIQVKNGSTAITDAISININDKVMARAASIDDAQQTIAAGGTLKVTCTKAAAANVACIVIVRGLRVA